MNNSPGGLFVGDLSVCFQEGHLRELFQPFGTILKTELRQGFKAHKLLGHGFVTFSTFEEADNAMKQMQGFLVLGRRLRIIWASNNNSFHKETVCAEVVFSFVSKQLIYMVYEQTIRDLFSGYGCDVIDVSLKQFKLEENLGKQSGIGFVHFPLTPQGILAAKMAVDQLTNVSIREIMYDSELSMNLQTIIEDNPHLDTPSFIPVHPPPKKGVPKQRRGASNPITLPFELPYQRKSAFAHLIRHTNVMGGMGMNGRMGQNSYGQNQYMDGKFGRQAQLLAHSYVPCHYAEPIPAPIAMPPALAMGVHQRQQQQQQQQQQFANQGMAQTAYQAEMDRNAERRQDPPVFQLADETRSDYPHERRLSVDLSASTSCEEIQVGTPTNHAINSVNNNEASAQAMAAENSAQTDSDTDGENPSSPSGPQESSAATTEESSVDGRDQSSVASPSKPVAAVLSAALNAPEFVPQAKKVPLSVQPVPVQQQHQQQQAKAVYVPAATNQSSQQPRYNSQTRQDIADERMRSRSGQQQGQAPLSSQQWSEQYYNEQAPAQQQYQPHGQYPPQQQSYRQQMPPGPPMHHMVPPTQHHHQQQYGYPQPQGPPRPVMRPPVNQQQQQQQYSPHMYSHQQQQQAPAPHRLPPPPPQQYADYEPQHQAVEYAYEGDYYPQQQQQQARRPVLPPGGVPLHRSPTAAVPSPQQKQLELQRERAALLRRQQQLEAELAGISSSVYQHEGGEYYEERDEQQEEYYAPQPRAVRQQVQPPQRMAAQPGLRPAPVRPQRAFAQQQQTARRRYADETEAEYGQYLDDLQYGAAAGSYSYDEYEAPPLRQTRRPPQQQIAIEDPYAQQAPPLQRRSAPAAQRFAPAPRQYFEGEDEEVRDEQYAYDSAEEQQEQVYGGRAAQRSVVGGGGGGGGHQMGQQQQAGRRHPSRPAQGLLSSILSEVDYSFGPGGSLSSGVAPLDLSGFDSDLFR